jgi:TatD DNase family protein
MLIDTHCHIDLPPLCDQRASLLEEARKIGICQWVVPAVSPSGWDRLLSICNEDAGLLPTAGIHPAAAQSTTGADLERLEAVAANVIAIGEIGLDRNIEQPELQEQLFRRQIRIAQNQNLPILVHCRGEIAKTLTILKQEQAFKTGGIMHAFSGSVDSAKQFIQLGFAISICGTITYSNAVKPLKLASELSLEHLVIETDAPDMTPQNCDGNFNRPAYLAATAFKLAQLKNVDLETVAHVTSATARKSLKLCKTVFSCKN